MKDKSIFNKISMTKKQIGLFNAIRTRGDWEQEKQLLFPTLYGSKAVTKSTIGKFTEFNNNLKRGKFEP